MYPFISYGSFVTLNESYLFFYSLIHLSFSSLVSGFGIRGHIRRVPSTKLNYVSLRIVSQETCNNAFKVLKISTNTSVLSDNMFCAGLPEGGKDPCSGDAGGPFALKDDGLFWAAGIISWGVGCGKPGAYGVYTKVANYVHWIKKTVQEN